MLPCRTLDNHVQAWCRDYVCHRFIALARMADSGAVRGIGFGDLYEPSTDGMWRSVQALLASCRECEAQQAPQIGRA